MKEFIKATVITLIITLVTLGVSILTFSSLPFAFFIVYSLISLQGIFSIYWMLYAWEDKNTIDKNSPPEKLHQPRYSFTALLPVRHEEKVIEDTIRAIDNIDYPESLKEIIIICRTDDTATINKAKTTIEKLHNPHIRLLLFNDFPINKPHQLNIGLLNAKNEIVVVFDAEDQPHPDIYKVVNTSIIDDCSDVVQSGVQLINYKDSWFATFNVLEYFFWFKSTLHYFSKMGIIPLGGNTVFFKKNWLMKVGGWDETCLTEDADIGIRLSTMGARIKVIYSAELATREETPHTAASFVKQRTRWHQGFMQVFLKGDWLNLPTFWQRFLACYILILPEIQALLFLMIPISFLMAVSFKLPVILAMFTSLPLVLLILQLITYCIGLFEFTKAYKFKFPILMPIKIFLTFFPYQILLGVSACRAIKRMVLKDIGWEKTIHINAHRETTPAPIPYE